MQITYEQLQQQILELKSQLAELEKEKNMLIIKFKNAKQDKKDQIANQMELSVQKYDQLLLKTEKIIDYLSQL